MSSLVHERRVKYLKVTEGLGSTSLGRNPLTNRPWTC